MADLYEIIFPETIFDYSGNTQVVCPFPHHINDTEYYETNPSAGIDISKGLFHCFACNRGFNKITFTKEYFHTDEKTALELINILETSEDVTDWEPLVHSLNKSPDAQQILTRLGFSPKIVNELKLGYSSLNGIDIPIIFKNRIVDVVQYFPGQTPKYKRRKQSMSGFIFPYDEWIKTPKTKNTIICAGEKDCICARQHGLNAISFTGGEQTEPKLFLNDFKDRNVYVLYDNDETGHKGSLELGITLKKYAKTVHIVDISAICKEPKEDLWDFFNKYNKTVIDLKPILEEAKEVTDLVVQTERNKKYPLINLYTATKPQYVDKLVRSNIQVIATSDQTFRLPTLIKGIKKTSSNSEYDTLNIGETLTWELTPKNYKDIFYLIGSKLKEQQITLNIRDLLLKIPKKEPGMVITKQYAIPVYNCVVTDVANPTETTTLTEFNAYSLGDKLENGKKYTITYKLVPHPQDGQKLIMVIKDIEEADDFLDNFKLTPEIILSLKKFQPNGLSKEDKFQETVEKVKGILHADYDNTLITVIDLWYHTVLQFQVGSLGYIRGYLDTLIVGESRIGKSSTVEALHEMYGLGKVVSLAGNSATPAGLIGGSNMVAGSYQTRAGLIPQNNKGAIIFEELVKCNCNLIRDLTEIRSSGKVRISRVNGNIELPALVRMLTLTNPKPVDGMSKPINEYPNGISILKDLIGTAEDIARYDMIAIFGFNANKEIDPFFEPPKPYDQQDYKNRIRWIWSRKPEDIIISKEIYQYTINKCNEINKKYVSHIKIFGIEFWKKVMRLAIAVAGYLILTDETFEKIIVDEYCIDKAIDLLINLYDNPTFKFKEYCDNENKYKNASNEDVSILQQLYATSSIVLDTLDNMTSISRQQLQMLSGLSQEPFTRLINNLAQNNFIICNTSITPTDKFKKAYQKINKLLNKPKEVRSINVSLE